jgi:signal peptidase I
MRLASILTRAIRRTLDVLLIAVILVVLATITVARIIPSVTGGSTFVVGGGSMEPTIPFGSVVIVTPVNPADLHVGDVVSMRVGNDEAVFTHRIVRLVPRDDGLWLETKGDNNAKNDPSIIPASTVVGRLQLGIPYAGYAVRLLSTGPGVLFLLAIGVMILAGAWFLESLELDQEMARRQAGRARAALAIESPVNEGATG